jgi:BMFP domain-containing protein YqiC
MDSFRIDEIARRLMDNLPPAFRATQRDLESNFRVVLRASLSKLDLVPRDEFDTQSRVLERTRARLEALEARVEALEGAGGAAADTAAGSTAPTGGAGSTTGPTSAGPSRGATP